MGATPIATYGQYSGGITPKYNITAIGVIKAAPGQIKRLIVQVAGTTTPLIVNDIALIGSAAIGNQVASIPAASLVAGAIILLDWPCVTGIALSGTWPTGLVLAVAYS